ncbi:MAG: glycosyltransferase family 1 protein [candidate division WOR-3 bacterium]
MRLLINAAFDTRTTVGITQYIRHMVEELSQLCEVTVLTPDPSLLATRCETIKVPDFTRYSTRRTAWAMTALTGYCTRRYDALLSVTPIVPPLATIPTVATVHDLIPLIMNRSHRGRDKATFWLGLQTLRWANAVICDSKNTRLDLLRLRLLPPKRIHVVTPGQGLLPSVDSDCSGNSSVTGILQPYILYVGGHPPHKNLARLLTAFSRLKFPEVTRLVIVGWGTSQHIAATKAVIAKLGLTDRVVLLSDVPDQELSKLYRRCTLFVFPSLYEGFGLPVLEALAHGAPVVCSRAASIPEVAGSAALYFNPLSTRDIIQTIQTVIDNTQLADQLRRLGPNQANRFSWALTASKIYAIVKSVTE